MFPAEHRVLPKARRLRFVPDKLALLVGRKTFPVFVPGGPNVAPHNPLAPKRGVSPLATPREGVCDCARLVELDRSSRQKPDENPLEPRPRAVFGPKSVVFPSANATPGKRIFTPETHFLAQSSPKNRFPARCGQIWIFGQKGGFWAKSAPTGKNTSTEPYVSPLQNFWLRFFCSDKGLSRGLCMVLDHFGRKKIFQPTPGPATMTPDTCKRHV